MQPLPNEPSDASVLARCSMEVECYASFMYYPDYNPLRKLEAEIPAPSTPSDKLYCVKPREVNNRFDALINCYRRCVKQDQQPNQSTDLANLYRSSTDLIEKYADNTHAKALTLRVIGTHLRLNQHSEESTRKWLKQAIKHNYPLALYLLGVTFLRDKQLSEGYRCLCEAVDRGEYLACIPLTKLFETPDLLYFNRAAAYSYNLLGCSNDIFECCVRLAISYVNGMHAPRDLTKALQYMERAQHLYHDPQNAELLALVRRIASIKVSEQALLTEVERDLRMNNLQESWIVESHLRNLQGGSKILTKDVYSAQQSCVNYFDHRRRVFHLAERSVEGGLVYQLLVVNEEGQFDRICINLAEAYDKRYPRSLLTKVGTRITLKFANRKIALDGMLQWCIINPAFIEFQPPEANAQQYRLSPDRIREMAKRLFAYEMYERCIFLYEQLALKCPASSDSLYCNVSMCLVRMQRYKQAEAYALKSLKLVPQNQKYIYRLSFCLWKLGRPDQAKQRLSQIAKPCPESQELLSAINKELVVRAENLDFSSKQYCRTRGPPAKQLYFEIDRRHQYQLVYTSAEVMALVRTEEKLLRNWLKLPTISSSALATKMLRIMKLPLDWRHETTAYQELGEFFALSYGYVRHHTQLRLAVMKDILVCMDQMMLERSLQEPAYTNTRVLAIRQTHLENRIETAVLSLVDFGKRKEAVSLCRLAVPYNSVLAHRCVQLLRELQQYEQALCVSNDMIAEMVRLNLPHHEFNMSNAKCYRSLGQYDKSNECCASLYNSREYGVGAYLLTSLNYFSRGLCEEALVSVNHSMKLRSTFEAGLHRIRLLLKTKQTKEAIESARSMQKQLDQCKQHLTKNMLKKACLNLELSGLMDLKDNREFVKCCERICQLDKRNINFVEDKLWLFVRNYSWLEDATLSLVEEHMELKEVANGLRERQAQLREDDSTDCEHEDADSSNRLDPRSLHAEHLKQKQRLKRPDNDLIDASLDLANSLLNEFPGYVTHFHQNNKLYVVVFDEDMWLDSLERGQFYRAAAKGFAKTMFESPGIKMLENNFYELKIMHSDYRLVGRGQPSDEKTVIHFYRRIDHNGVRRVVQHG